VTDKNHQINIHLVGPLEGGVLEALTKELDCNTYPSEDSRSRLNWLVNTANLVVILPGWRDQDSWVMELTIAQELAIPLKFLWEVLPNG
jgi:hypothetical protein